MNTMLLKLYVNFQSLMNRDEGQDLIEYALLAGLLALAAYHCHSGCWHWHQTIFTNISTSSLSFLVPGKAT